MMLPMLIGAGVGAITKGLPYIARGLSAEGQAEARQAKEDIEKLKRNEFGPGQGQQERMVQDALAMARASSQSARAEVSRQQNASGVQSGSQGLASQRIAADASKNAGTLRMSAADTAAKVGAQAKADALARVKARADKTEQDVASVLGGAASGAASQVGAEGMDWSGLVSTYGSTPGEQATAKNTNAATQATLEANELKRRELAMKQKEGVK